MNYLGHLFLSGQESEVIYGNFIADVIKGNQWKKYGKEVQKGIKLHRFIDSFTDNHTMVHAAKARIRPYFGLTSGIVIDMYFDHFLSLKWNDYHELELSDFTRNMMTILSDYKNEMPSYTGVLFEKMRNQDWISSYKTIDGIAFALGQMANRVKFNTQWNKAGDVLIEHYIDLEDDFRAFIPDLISKVIENFNINLKLSNEFKFGNHKI